MAVPTIVVVYGGDSDNPTIDAANFANILAEMTAELDSANIEPNAMEDEVGLLETSMDFTKLRVENLVANGDMESWADGTATFPSGWATESSPTAVARDTADTGHGSYCLKITTADANDGAKLTLTGLKVSTVYRVTCRAKATAGDTAKLLTTGATTNISETSTSTSWTTLTGIFTTDGSGTDVVIKLVGSGGAGDIVWFDSVVCMEGTAGMGFIPSPISGLIALCAASADNVSVTGAKILVVDTSGASVTIGGLAGGVAGQTVRIIKQSTSNSLIIEHEESTGTQKIRIADEGDATLTGFGGMTLSYDGNYWYQITE